MSFPAPLRAARRRLQDRRLRRLLPGWTDGAEGVVDVMPHNAAPRITIPSERRIWGEATPSRPPDHVEHADPQDELARVWSDRT